jgi:hypothetical protein
MWLCESSCTPQADDAATLCHDLSSGSLCCISAIVIKRVVRRYNRWLRAKLSGQGGHSLVLSQLVFKLRAQRHSTRQQHSAAGRSRLWIEIFHRQPKPCQTAGRRKSLVTAVIKTQSLLTFIVTPQPATREATAPLQLVACVITSRVLLPACLTDALLPKICRGSVGRQITRSVSALVLHPLAA